MILSVMIEQVERLLSSATQNENSEELIFDGIISAHTAILPWVPNLQETIISGSDSRTFQLPDDVFTVEGVYDPADSVMLRETLLKVGSVWGGLANNEITWANIPNGYITLNDDLPSGGTTLGLIYYALWPVPENDTDGNFIISVPSYALTAIALYAASYVLAVYSVDTSSQGQYKQKLDSGRPTDNPIQNSSEFFLKRFQNEMGRMPQIKRLVDLSYD